MAGRTGIGFIPGSHLFVVSTDHGMTLHEYHAEAGYIEERGKLAKTSPDGKWEVDVVDGVFSLAQAGEGKEAREAAEQAVEQTPAPTNTDLENYWCDLCAIAPAAYELLTFSTKNAPVTKRICVSCHDEFWLGIDITTCRSRMTSAISHFAWEDFVDRMRHGRGLLRSGPYGIRPVMNGLIDIGEGMSRSVDCHTGDRPKSDGVRFGPGDVMEVVTIDEPESGEMLVVGRFAGGPAVASSEFYPSSSVDPFRWKKGQRFFAILGDKLNSVKVEKEEIVTSTTFKVLWREWVAPKGLQHHFTQAMRERMHEVEK